MRRVSITLPRARPVEKAAREAKDAAILNARADRLNEEARDVLEYQGLP